MGTVDENLFVGNGVGSYRRPGHLLEKFIERSQVEFRNAVDVPDAEAGGPGHGSRGLRVDVKLDVAPGARCRQPKARVDVPVALQVAVVVVALLAAHQVFEANGAAGGGFHEHDVPADQRRPEFDLGHVVDLGSEPAKETYEAFRRYAASVDSDRGAIGGLGLEGDRWLQNTPQDGPSPRNDNHLDKRGPLGCQQHFDLFGAARDQNVRMVSTFWQNDEYVKTILTFVPLGPTKMSRWF